MDNNNPQTVPQSPPSPVQPQPQQNLEQQTVPQQMEEEAVSTQEMPEEQQVYEQEPQYEQEMSDQGDGSGGMPINVNWGQAGKMGLRGLMKVPGGIWKVIWTIFNRYLKT